MDHILIIIGVLSLFGVGGYWDTGGGGNNGLYFIVAGLAGT
jgi:hypothetical protein